jgi:hypothetical protein
MIFYLHLTNVQKKRPNFAWSALIHSLLLALLVGFTAAQTPTPLNDASFRTAVELWKTDPAAATAQFGNIEAWDVSDVTNFTTLGFDETFNADLSSWNTSSAVDMSEVGADHNCS